MSNNAKSPPEPSMEEIIASISRIIAEDKKPNEPVRPTAAENNDVLELTEVINDDGSVRKMTLAAGNSTAPFAKSAAPPDPPAASAFALGEAELPKPDEHPELGTEPAIGTSRERILSAARSDAAAAAFAKLGGLPRERRREGELPLGGPDRTLEDVVRDILRPLLQTWLDENLPGIVERLVRDEIARVVDEARLR
jgi:cell pole-organizing protein PopZ